MAVPRNRHSNARKNTRRAHHAKKPRETVACSHCQVEKLPHTLCQACGYYEGQQIIAVAAE